MADLSDKLQTGHIAPGKLGSGRPFGKFETAAPVLPERAENGDSVSEFAAGIFTSQAIKGYPLTHILAASDRSAVFKALDPVMDRPVAVKAMRPYPGRAGAVEEFFSLAGSIARLRCPGVARGLDAGRSPGAFYLVYEFVSGETLAAKMARRQSGKLTEKEAARLVRALAEVLRNLFEAGHPHGNLKPANVILADGGKPFLTDIAFAWTMAWPDDAGAFLAKPDFLPPERLAGELNIDIRGDLYSLGAMWFWLLLGRAVFPADQETAGLEAAAAEGGADGPDPLAALLKRRDRKAPTARALDANISDDTSKLIQWLLEKNRDARPRTPREFLRRLASHPLLAEEGGGMAEAGEAGTEMDAETEAGLDATQ